MESTEASPTPGRWVVGGLKLVIRVVVGGLKIRVGSIKWVRMMGWDYDTGQRLESQKFTVGVTTLILY